MFRDLLPEAAALVVLSLFASSVAIWAAALPHLPHLIP